MPYASPPDLRLLEAATSPPLLDFAAPTPRPGFSPLFSYSTPAFASSGATRYDIAVFDFYSIWPTSPHSYAFGGEQASNTGGGPQLFGLGDADADGEWSPDVQGTP